MGAQRFRDDDPMLDDRATGVLLLCVVVVAACRLTMLAVETEVLCSVLQKGGIGQFLAGRVTSWFTSVMGDGLESSFGRVAKVYAVNYKSCSCFCFVCR